MRMHWVIGSVSEPPVLVRFAHLLKPPFLEPNLQIVRTVSFQEKPIVHALSYKVTGSNSVNVFLGLGLAWLIGTVRLRRRTLRKQERIGTVSVEAKVCEVETSSHCIRPGGSEEQLSIFSRFSLRYRSFYMADWQIPSV